MVFKVYMFQKIFDQPTKKNNFARSRLKASSDRSPEIPNFDNSFATYVKPNLTYFIHIISITSFNHFCLYLLSSLMMGVNH